MEGFQAMLLVLILISPCSASQEVETDSQTHLQNVYPGCKASLDESDMSYPQCNLTTFKESYMRRSIRPTDLAECFRESSSITISSMYLFRISSNWRASSDVSFGCQNVTCVCELIILGPPGSHYDIQGKGDTTELKMKIHYGVKKTEVTFNKRNLIRSRQSNVTFKLEYDGPLFADVDFRLSFRAWPSCVRELQVKCLSNTTGMIQTFGWSRYTGYPFMDSCVKLHVPENHVAMISLVSIDLDLQRNQMDCADYLFIDNSGKCSAHDDNRNAICQMQDLRPTVINGHMILSFRFKSDRGSFWLKPGFRLLYSFHKRSEEPEQLPDGQWNCSVPYYASFQMHFVCMDESFCSNRSIEVKCPQHEGMCGFKSIPFGGSCYRFMKPAQRTWVDASDACVHHGGRLAVFNTASTWTNTSAFLQEINPAKRSLFIGLRMAPSVTLPEMYQDCWFWSDNTLAVYLPFKLANVESPYCAIFDDKILDTISCNSIVNAAVLCETTSTSDHAVNDTDVTVVTSSTWMMDNMTTCRHGHTTHTFLACDISTNCSAMSQDEVLPCSNGFSPPVPFFTCRNQMGRVPYTLVCDFRSDCCDGSDEDFCQLPTCGSRREFECSDGKQCVHRDRVCDKRSDCVDGSDEMKCRDILTASDVPVNFIDPPARVDFTGRGSFTVTKLHNTCSETHFQCPGEGYCLPVYVRCNRVNDCPGKEDEKNCDHYTCPGFYRCRHSKICLHRQHLCDGVFQCPQHDDEWLCNVTCPDTCHCYGHAFICTGSFTADTYPELRYVDASGTGMTPANFLNNTKLINLNLRHCKLTSLGLLDFPNLHNLDLSYNNIRELDSSQLTRLIHLVSLSLAYNPVMSLDSFLSSDVIFPNIINVNVSGVKLHHPNDTFFNKFPKAKYLNMSNSGLTKLTKTGFKSVKFLRVIDLDGCPIETFFPGVFEGLNHLETVYTINYKLCCPADLPKGMDPNRCNSPVNEISSCDALLRTDVFRVFLAVYASLSLIGNAGSFVYRVCIERSAAKLGYEVFVTHLSLADFLMGVYLAIIGTADRLYFGNYRWNDAVWKHSVACKLAGFLSLVSSEVSAFLISLITLERALVISFPYKNLRFSQESAHAASMAVWLIGMVLGLIPLLPMTSNWNFYSQSGICVPLPITRKQFGGSGYAFGVIIILNFVLFLFIAVGQFLIYWSIRRNTIGCSDNKRKSRDMAIARRLLAVVLTDFMCWFPIGLLGMMARSGVPISGEINVAIAIFVLPFNSALNPFLYTLNVVRERRQKMANIQKSQIKDENRTRVFDVVSERRRKENT